jgi:hypothetical protein
VAYTSGSSSEFGWGVSATGKYGSWKAEGTNSKSATATQGFGTKTGKFKTQIQTQFTFGKHRITTSCLMRTRYVYRVESYNGGNYSYETAKMPATNKAYCVRETKGDSFEKSSTAATTWTNGVSASAVIGMDLSAKTGFNKNTKVTYKFSGTAALCGASSKPGNNPGYLFARPASVL